MDRHLSGLRKALILVLSYVLVISIDAAGILVPSISVAMERSFNVILMAFLLHQSLARHWIGP